MEQTIIKLSKAFKIPQLEPEDVAQELRIHLWEQRHRYDKKRPYKDWAYIVCRNKIKDLARKHNKEKDNVSLTEEILKKYEIQL